MSSVHANASEATKYLFLALRDKLANDIENDNVHGSRLPRLWPKGLAPVCSLP